MRVKTNYNKTPGRGYRFDDYMLIEGYFHSAQGLIAHFRDALYAQVPFTKDCNTQSLSKLTNIDDEETQFLVRLRDHLCQAR